MKPTILNAEAARVAEQNGAAAIPSAVDRRYRAGLTALVNANGNRAARWHVMQALERGPSRGGAAEAMNYFGAELDAKLKLTAMVVDATEISLPGFKKWLHLTGFGNDRRMIMAFVAWAEHLNGQGQVLRSVADHAVKKLLH